MHWQRDILQELIKNLEEDNMDDLPDDLYPELTLETEDIIMILSIKKDYSQITDFKKRKEEFIKDLHEFIEEFDETPESDDFVRYFDY